jgi:phosphatidylserine/phosphatidylglycerophosphate/cardiolipin synthase-like enzyme
MPNFVLRASPLARSATAGLPESARRATTLRPSDFTIELVGRNCRLEDYKKIKVPPVDVAEEIIAYCSPDSTYAVTRRLFDGAKKSILIGIYDFSAPHMKELVMNALRRKVTVQLMLDIDGEREQKLFNNLIDEGVDGTPAPSCASQHDNKYFSSSHEKVIVIDGLWTLVQSGNYSDNSIPLNTVDGGDPDHFRTGNRDTGLAIRSRKLAKFFTTVLESDIALELSGPESLAAAARVAAEVFLVEAAPTKPPAQFFPSKTFKASKLTVQPVLSPDNYMSVVPDKLRAARKSILIEQQYVRGSQDKIADLLAAIAAARKAAPKLDVRILLGKVFAKRDIPKEQQNLDLLRDKYGLKLGKNIRFIDVDRFVHCHNKMALVDGKGVLVSSQNWSKSAVWLNREAGVWFEHAGICNYFTRMFESDWKTARKSLTAPEPEVLAPEALRAGGFVQVSPADYREV